MTAPAGHNESLKCELLGLRVARGSSGTLSTGGGKEARSGVFDGDKDGGGARPWL